MLILQTFNYLSRVAAFFVVLIFCTAFQPLKASAAEGFYIGGAVGGAYSNVDYSKSVGVDVPTPTQVQADDKEWDDIYSLKLLVGHRWNLTDKMYFSGEVDGQFGLGQVKGFLKGTGLEERQVWPGSWFLEKNYGVGFSAKLGYEPGDIRVLNNSTSVYILTGVQWFDLEVEGAHDNGDISGRERRSRSAFPWLVGGGVEFGGDKNRVDLRMTYTSYDVDFGLGDGTATANPRLDYDFKVKELGIFIGYSWALGFGLGG